MMLEYQIYKTVNSNHAFAEGFARDVAEFIRKRGQSESDVVSMEKYHKGFVGVKVTLKDYKITAYA